MDDKTPFTRGGEDAALGGGSSEFIRKKYIILYSTIVRVCVYTYTCVDVYLYESVYILKLPAAGYCDDGGFCNVVPVVGYTAVVRPEAGTYVYSIHIDILYIYTCKHKSYTYIKLYNICIRTCVGDQRSKVSLLAKRIKCVNKSNCTTHDEGVASTMEIYGS